MTSDDTIVAAQKQMQRAAKALESMSEALAAAKQVKEYDSDRRKRVLAIAMKVFLELGDTAAAADCKARASSSYGDSLIELGGQLQTALETIEKADAARVLFESSRSILSTEKAKLGLL